MSHTKKIEMLDAMIDYLSTLDRDAPLPSLQETLRGAAVVLGKKVEADVQQAVLKEKESARG